MLFNLKLIIDSSSDHVTYSREVYLFTMILLYNIFFLFLTDVTNVFLIQALLHWSLLTTNIKVVQPLLRNVFYMIDWNCYR